MGTAAAIAVVARARRELAEHFRLAGATSPSTPVPLPETHGVGRRALNRWLRTGVVREAPGGGYWLDERAYHQSQQLQRRGVLIALAVVLFIFLVAGVAASVFGGGGRYQ